MKTEVENQHVSVMPDTMKKMEYVLNVPTNVSLVQELVTVKHVMVSELTHQIVFAQIVIMMTELMLNVNHVIQNVQLVQLMKHVLPVLTEDLTHQHVTVIMELSKMLMNNVNHVTTHVQIAQEPLIIVIHVLTQPDHPTQNVLVMQDIMILDQQNAHHVTSNVLNVTLTTTVQSVLETEQANQLVELVPLDTLMMKSILTVRLVNLNSPTVLNVITMNVPYVLTTEKHQLATVLTDMLKSVDIVNHVHITV